MPFYTIGSVLLVLLVLSLLIILTKGQPENVLGFGFVLCFWFRMIDLILGAHRPDTSPPVADVVGARVEVSLVEKDVAHVV